MCGSNPDDDDDATRLFPEVESLLLFAASSVEVMLLLRFLPFFAMEVAEDAEDDGGLGVGVTTICVKTAGVSSSIHAASAAFS